MKALDLALRRSVSTGEMFDECSANGCHFGSDKPSGQQVVQQSNSPWSGQQPFLTDVFDKAKSLYGQQVAQPQFPNSTVVPFSNQTESALGMIENRATQGNAAQQGANTKLAATLQGDYLSAGNPYFSQMADRVRSEVLPNINAGFNAAGRTGSGLAARAAGLGVGDAIGALAFKNYGDERTKQIQAAGLAPSVAAADYQDAQALQGVGSAREGMAGQQLQEQINRYYYPMQNQADALQRYAGTVAGGSFGSNVSQTSPLYSNTAGNALGSALGLASLGNSLMGSGNQGLLKSLGIF